MALSNEVGLSIDEVQNACYLAVCEETGDVVVASDCSQQFAVIRYPSGRVHCCSLPDSVTAILSMHFFACDTATNSHYLSFLLKTETDHLVCIYDCYEEDVEPEYSNRKSTIYLTLTMPIPVSSVWNKDYGIWNQDHGPPQAILPIPHHPFGAMLVCEKAVGIFDFHVLYSTKKTKGLEVNHIAMMWPTTGPAQDSGVPVHLVREFFFKKSPGSGERASLTPETSQTRLQENAFHRILSFDYGSGNDEKSLDEEWWKVSLMLCLDEGTLETIRLTYQRSESHTEWRVNLMETQGISCLSPRCNLRCLPRGNLFFYSLNLDHFLLSRLHEGNEVQYRKTQILENSGPITDLLIRQNADHETGRVFYTASPDESSGSIKIMSSGIMTEDLCLSPQFSCLTHLWKIRSSNRLQSREFLVASFLHETRILIFKDGIFVDGTHLVGILTNEPTIYCAPLNHSFFVQVTPSRVALCAMRVSDEIKTDKAFLRGKHISSSNLASEEMDCEAIPRRWSFSNFNAQQLSSMLRFADKPPTIENEGPESIWYSSAQRDLPNGHDGSSLTPRGFLDLTFWGRKPEKSTKTEQIMCAAVFDETVCLFSSTTASLILLELEDVSQHGLSHQSRKRSRPTVRLKTVIVTEIADLHPSCMVLTTDGTTGSMICAMGTYSSSVEVFLLCPKKKSCQHLWSLEGEALYDACQLDADCTVLDATRFDKQDLPVPESIAVGGTLDKQGASCLLVGFRNGVLVEYSIQEGWQGASLKRMMQVGALPVHLEQIRPDLLLAYSNRSFLLKMEPSCPPTSKNSCQIGNIKQINLPSHIKCCAVLTTASDLMLWKEGEEKRAVELPEILECCRNGERMRYLFVYADVDGLLHMAHIPRQVQSIATDQPIEKLIQLPKRHQILGTSKATGIYLIDVKQRTLCLCYKMKAEEYVSAVCLWPRPSPCSSTADAFSPATTRRETQDTSSLGRSEFRLRNYMKTVRGVAAALTCCHSFITCPSDVSTPRDTDGNPVHLWPNAPNSAVFIALGTGKVTQPVASLEAVERGALRLLRMNISEGEASQCRITRVAHRRLPDPVSSLASFDEKNLMVGVGSRIVPYQLSDCRWEKSPNWLSIRDPVTAMHVFQNVVATGDDFNSVVLYKFTAPQTPSSPDKLEHIRSGKNARGIMDVHMDSDDRIAAIDNHGNVVFFSSTSENPESSERNLVESATIPLRTHLTALKSTDVLDGVNEYVECLIGGHRDRGGRCFVVSSKLGSIYLVARMLSDVSPKLHERPVSQDRESEMHETSLLYQEYNAGQRSSYLTFCFS